MSIRFSNENSCPFSLRKNFANDMLNWNALKFTIDKSPRTTEQCKFRALSPETPERTVPLPLPLLLMAEVTTNGVNGRPTEDIGDDHFEFIGIL